jgi:betaine lipid synthase
MGAGRDGNHGTIGNPVRRNWSSEKLAALQGVKDDLIVLKSIWFNKSKGGDHAQRLENFYSPQAAACK